MNLQKEIEGAEKAIAKITDSMHFQHSTVFTLNTTIEKQGWGKVLIALKSIQGNYTSESYPNLAENYFNSLVYAMNNLASDAMGSISHNYQSSVNYFFHKKMVVVFREFLNEEQKKILRYINI
jgi:hypothetical protein